MSSEKIRTVVVSKPLHRPRGCEEGEELPWNEEEGGGVVTMNIAMVPS